MYHHWTLALQNYQRKLKTQELPYEVEKSPWIPFYSSSQKSAFWRTIKEKCNLFYKFQANFNDTTVNKYHGVPFPPSRRGYIKLLKHVEEFYEKLIKGVYEPINYFESGNHIVYDKLGAGDKIALL